MKHTKIFFILLSLCVMGFSSLTSCQKEYSTNSTLAITSRLLNFKKNAGQTHVMVYSTGDWTVRFKEKVDWASLSKTSGSGTNDFIFSYSDNYGLPRGVTVVIEGQGRMDTIRMIQAGFVTSPSISFELDSLVLPNSQIEYSMKMITNLMFSMDQMTATATYYDNTGKEIETLPIGQSSAKITDPWITGYKINALDSTIVLSVKDNGSGQDRKVMTTFTVYNAADRDPSASVIINQSAKPKTFVLSETQSVNYANAKDFVIPATENNMWALPETGYYDFQCSADWILNKKITKNGLEFSVTENTTGAQRTGVIYLYFNPGPTVSYKVTQNPYKLIEFSELRKLVPGKITTSEYIEGYVISDPKSKNISSAPQTGQYQYDTTDIAKNAYIESIDGKYGLRLKFTSAAANSMTRYSKTVIKLEGATLVKETDPVRYTLTGLTASNVTASVPGTLSDVPEKKLYVSQLTDDDIYTLVQLGPVEILQKDGCFTNASEGYTYKRGFNPMGNATEPRWVAAPLMCYDKNGDAISMLTNEMCPWRRTGGDKEWNSVVPQKAGYINGVIVADDVVPVRWGDLGKYQIRAMYKEDIDLTHDDMVFSNVICEWNKFATWSGTTPTYKPDQGVGTIDWQESTAKAETTFSMIPDYNNPSGQTSEKGLAASCAIRLQRLWYDVSSQTGKYIDFSFSTAGLSGTSLVFGIVWGMGNQDDASINGPAHFSAQYSTDGTNFQEIPDAGIVKQRGIAWWANTSQDACPGYTEHLIRLPQACFGKSKVYVRLKVMDSVSDKAPNTSPSTYLYALGCEKGEITASTTKNNCMIRIGTVTVRYNK